MKLTEEEWRQHRLTAERISDLGECSIVNGKVKIEGHLPFPVRMAHDYKYTLPQRYWTDFEQFLIRHGITPLHFSDR